MCPYWNLTRWRVIIKAVRIFLLLVKWVVLRMLIRKNVQTLAVQRGRALGVAPGSRGPVARSRLPSQHWPQESRFVIVMASASSLPRTQRGTSPKSRADSGPFLPGCVTPPLPSLRLFDDPTLVLPTHCLHARRILRDGLDSHSVCRKETSTTKLSTFRYSDVEEFPAMPRNWGRETREGTPGGVRWILTLCRGPPGESSTEGRGGRKDVVKTGQLHGRPRPERLWASLLPAAGTRLARGRFREPRGGSVSLIFCLLLRSFSLLLYSLLFFSLRD